MIARQESRRHRGITMIIAVTLLALTSAAAVAVSALVLSDVRRTQRETDESQLRQLLIAGAADAAARLQQAGEPPKEWSVKLPEELTARGASLKLTAITAGSFAVVAQYGGHLREQRLVYQRDAGGRWRLTSAASD